MGRTASNYDQNDYYGDGTTANSFIKNFSFGRTTLNECPSAHGLLPNPELGCDGLQTIFIDHIYSGTTGRQWELTAAISGAHTLGSASIGNSGYDGFWGDATQAGIFNNDYYKGILFKGWGVELGINGNTDKN